jgi:serine/threonine protein kinase
MILVSGEVIQGYHKYTVDKAVGTGAYACVYRTTDELGRVVALKEYFAAQNPREAPMLKKLFERERYVMSQVSPHPLIPTFYEGFIFDNQFYIAQEFIEGRSLDDVIREDKTIAREWMLKWAISLCEALSFIHARHIVHHDLKPPNIRITPENHLKLLDYGAAQFFGTPDKAVPESMLKDNELFGTEGYLPPEVEETFTADTRTDIFALGCILYEMVMGEAPEQQNINERNLYVTTPLMQRKDVDLAFVKLATTALSYNTEFRFSSAKMFLDELKKISQAMLMVSQKSVYFGTVDLKGSAQQKFRIYNGGGRGDLVGEIKPLVPWLKVEVPKFKTQKRDVILIVDPARVPQRNALVRGQVEIKTKDVVDEQGIVLARADKWVIDAYITINAKPPQLQVVETAGSAQTLAVCTRPNQMARLMFTLTNVGELIAEGHLEAADPDDAVQMGPDQFRLKPGESVQIAAVIPTRDIDVAGTHRTVAIKAVMGESQGLTIPILLVVQNLFHYLKGVIIRAIKRDNAGVHASPTSDVAGAKLLPPPKT